MTVSPFIKTSVCNSNSNSVQAIPPIPIVNTPVCNNNNSSTQDIPSTLSDTVTPQQTSVTLRSLNKSYGDL